MTLNVELLERVKAHILEEPRRFEMASWAEHSDDAPCGTAACIAGWALILEKGARLLDDGVTLLYRNNRRILSEGNDAARLLGIDIKIAMELFSVSRWPSDLEYEYLDLEYDDSLEGRQAKAEIAARRIDRFIAEHSAQGGQ